METGSKFVHKQSHNAIRHPSPRFHAQTQNDRSDLQGKPKDGTWLMLERLKKKLLPAFGASESKACSLINSFTPQPALNRNFGATSWTLCDKTSTLADLCRGEKSFQPCISKRAPLSEKDRKNAKKRNSDKKTPLKILFFGDLYLSILTWRKFTIFMIFVNILPTVEKKVNENSLRGSREWGK